MQIHTRVSHVLKQKKTRNKGIFTTEIHRKLLGHDQRTCSKQKNKGWRKYTNNITEKRPIFLTLLGLHSLGAEEIFNNPEL